MCAAKQFDLNQCATKQYVYQYKEWQCVWNQHVAKQDNQKQHTAEKHPDNMEQSTRNPEAPQQYEPNQNDEKENHLKPSAGETFSNPHDVDKHSAEDVCDLNKCTNREDYDFNQYAERQYLAERFPGNCFKGDECVEEDPLNPFLTEEYDLDPYFVDEYYGSGYDFNQMEVDTEQCELGPSQYVEKHSTESDQFAEEQYGLDQYLHYWYTLNPNEVAPNFTYRYTANQFIMEEQYQNTTQQFAPGYYAMNHYTPEQYLLNPSDLAQTAVGQHFAYPFAFPYSQQFVAVRYGPHHYAVGQYFSDHYAVAAQFFPQQCQVNQYPGSVFNPHMVKQHAPPPYRGDVCPWSQWPSGRFALRPYDVQNTAQQAAFQYETQQKYDALDQSALEQYALSTLDAEQCQNEYATSQNASNQFEAEQHEQGQYLTGNFAGNNLQQGLNPRVAEQFRVGHNDLGQLKTKQGVTNNSLAKQGDTSERMSDICSTDQCPAQQDANIQIEEKPGATEQDNLDRAEFSAAKHDCKDKETAELNQVPGLDSREGVGTSDPHVAKLDTKKSSGGAHFAEHAAATVQCDAEQSVQSQAARSKKDFSFITDVRSRPQPNTSNQPDAAAQLRAEQLTTNDMVRPCDASKNGGAGVEGCGVEEPPAGSAEKESLNVSEVSVQSPKNPNPDVTDWGDCCPDPAEVFAVELDFPEQKHERDKAVQDTSVQDGTTLDTTELQSREQNDEHQTARQLHFLEWDIATSSGYDLVVCDATKQDSAEQHLRKNTPDLCGVWQETLMPVFIGQDNLKQHFTEPEPENDVGRDTAVKGPTEQIVKRKVQAKQGTTLQHGINLSSAGHNSTHSDASDCGAKEQHLDPVGQIAAEANGATMRVTTKQEHPDPSSSVAKHGPFKNVRGMKPPMTFPSEEDFAGRYHTRGGRSCRTGCSRASFNKGQSSKARYYNRSHYSTRYCND